MRRVTVVDYGGGNIMSVVRAVEYCGAEVAVASNPRSVVGADRLVLPGVGSFARGMEELRSRGLDRAILDFASTGRPFLGICLGMQMMFEESEEFGHCTGLGLIPGQVRKIDDRTAEGRKRKVPHIGWNSIRSAADWTGTVLAGVSEGSFVYFVHSYAVELADPACLLATTEYDGAVIVAAVVRGAHYGCQFHPEKSGPDGLAIIHNFLNL